MKVFNITYKQSKNTYVFAGFFTVILLCICIISSLFFGSETIDILKIISQNDITPIEKIILFDIRLPRVLLSALCGMLLAGAGTVFQGFFRNPLADAGLVGISSGATFGAVLSILMPFSFTFFTLSLHPVVLFAFFGALGTALLVYILSYRVSGTNSTVVMLLIGTSLSAFLSAIVSVLLLIRFQQLHQVYVWTLGSFNGRGWNEVILIIGPTIIATILLLFCVRPLDILSQGEESAQSLGVDIKKTRALTLIAGSVSCACAVSVAGTIGFVGLIAPHIARKIYGHTHMRVLVFGMLWGAILLVISDTIARTIVAPSELPVGIVTALMGVPFFIFLIQKKRGIFGE